MNFEIDISYSKNIIQQTCFLAKVEKRWKNGGIIRTVGMYWEEEAFRGK